MVDLIGYWSVVSFVTLPLVSLVVYLIVDHLYCRIAFTYGSMHVPTLLNGTHNFLEKYLNKFPVFAVLSIGGLSQFTIVLISALDVSIKDSPSFAGQVIHYTDTIASKIGPLLGYLTTPGLLVLAVYIIGEIMAFCIGASIKLEKLEKSK